MTATTINQKSILNSFVDLIIDRIILFTDYFITKKHVTLSETTLFAVAVSWLIWFSLKGAFISGIDLNDPLWVGIFLFLSVGHFVGFFLKDILGRAIISALHAFIWCFLALLSLYSGTQSPNVATFFVFSLLSVFLAVRLYRERQQ